MEFLPGACPPIHTDDFSKVPGMASFEVLFEAKKGNAAVAKVTTADWGGTIARPAGVGKAVKRAWYERRTLQREIVLG